MSHVFVSYNVKDREQAKRIYDTLRKAKRLGWMAPFDIRPGGDWSQAIDHALRTAGAVIVVLTPNAVASEYVTYEWSFALGAGKPVVPILMKPIQHCHPRLSKLQHVDFTKPRQSWARLIHRILTELSVAETNFEVPGNDTDPVIHARFETTDGRPVLNKQQEYAIWLWVENVPEEAGPRVRYEILDPDFSDNPWTAARGQERNYETWISSYGDVLITVQGTGSQGTWRTRTTLYDALRRHYGDKGPWAINVIRDN